MNSSNKTLETLRRYRLTCTLSFGDVYGQIIVWLLVIFLSLAVAMGLMGASRPIFALATVGLILVLSLPFLLFAFVTTLLNHIEIREVDLQMQPKSVANSDTNTEISGGVQRPAMG
jgi:quinol-cytochrome oxidoreductase complex cytochrome b subunit